MTDFAQPRQAFWAGVRALAPLLLGVIPFGVLYGVLALKSGLTVWQAQAMSTLVFAGSAQIVICQMLASHTPLVVLFAAIAVINLRHMLYSASMAPHLGKVSLGWKSLLAYLLTDEAYAVVIQRLATLGSHRQWFVLGAGLTLWLNWQASTAVGLWLGANIPARWGLDFALPLTFIALIVPAIRSRADHGAVWVAGLVSVAAFALPYKLGLIVATLAGVGMGVLLSPKPEKTT